MLAESHGMLLLWVLKFDFALNFTEKKPAQYLWELIFPNISPRKIPISEIDIKQLIL